MNSKRRHAILGRQGLIYSLAIAMGILFLGGMGFWVMDPEVETFSDGLWLAFTTAATVGYGDLVPSTHASRGFAVVVVLLGLGVLSLVTASVAAILVERDVQEEERAIEKELIHEIRAVRLEVAALRNEVRALHARAGADGDPSQGKP